jgi:hypothetical protein
LYSSIVQGSLTDGLAAIDMSTFEALKLAYVRSTKKEEPGVLATLAFGSLSGSVGATVSECLSME